MAGDPLLPGQVSIRPPSFRVPKNLDPRLQDLLARLLEKAKAADVPLHLVGGFRTRAQQEALYKQKPTLAARPGHSRHETGMAVDLASAGKDALAWLGKEWQALGGRWGATFGEPWHFDIAEAATLKPPVTTSGDPLLGGLSPRLPAQTAIKISPPTPTGDPLLGGIPSTAETLKYLKEVKGAVPGKPLPKKIAKRQFPSSWPKFSDYVRPSEVLQSPWPLAILRAEQLPAEAGLWATMRALKVLSSGVSAGAGIAKQLLTPKARKGPVSLLKAAGRGIKKGMSYGEALEEIPAWRQFRTAFPVLGGAGDMDGHVALDAIWLAAPTAEAEKLGHCLPSPFAH